MQETKSSIMIMLHEIKREREKTFKLNRIIWFGGFVSLYVAATALVISSLWSANNYQNFIEQNQLKADFLKSLKASSLIRCADDNLCVKVDKHNKDVMVPHGYVLVAPRKNP